MFIVKKKSCLLGTHTENEGETTDTKNPRNRQPIIWEI